MLLAQHRALVADLRLIPLGFQPVEPADYSQHSLYGFRSFLSSVVEVASRVSPAPHWADSRRRACVTDIRRVGVGLQNAFKVLEQRGDLGVATRGSPLEDDIRLGPADDPQITLGRAAILV